MIRVTLKPGREGSLKRRHPWVFSGAVGGVSGCPELGDTVQVESRDGEWLAAGSFSPESQIAVRIWTFDQEEGPSPSFFRTRLQRAAEARLLLFQGREPAAYRLVNAESDGLPGLVVDRYRDFLVCQFLAAGVERWKETIVACLAELAAWTGIYERSDPAVRGKEGLPCSTGPLLGAAPPELLEIEEGPCRFLVDVRQGHKTGFYLDQRKNRAFLGEMSSGAEVLNCFAYTGAFGIRAVKGGAATVTNVEASAAAVAMMRRHADLNVMDDSRFVCMQADVFQALRKYRKEGRRFDIVVLDPPKFAESRSQLPQAARGYKDINLLAFQLLRTAGLLLTFSCSGHVQPELFQKIVADAALDAGRDAQIVGRLGQCPDHPVALNFPEGAYLKGLACRVW